MKILLTIRPRRIKNVKVAMIMKQQQVGASNVLNLYVTFVFKPINGEYYYNDVILCCVYLLRYCRLKITKDHTIKSKEEALQEHQNTSPSSNNKNLICPIHHNEQLTLFCENCDILTCRDCQLTDHRDHKYKFTHEIASETKKFIQGMLKDVK